MGVEVIFLINKSKIEKRILTDENMMTIRMEIEINGSPKSVLDFT